MTVRSLFCGADLAGEFDTRQEAERALDDAGGVDPYAANELVIVEFDETAGASASLNARQGVNR